MENIDNKELFGLYKEIFSKLKIISRMFEDIYNKKLKLKPVDVASVRAEKIGNFMTKIINLSNDKEVEADLTTIKNIFTNNPYESESLKNVIQELSSKFDDKISDYELNKCIMEAYKNSFPNSRSEENFIRDNSASEIHRTSNEDKEDEAEEVEKLKTSNEDKQDEAEGVEKQKTSNEDKEEEREEEVEEKHKTSKVEQIRKEEIQKISNEDKEEEEEKQKITVIREIKEDKTSPKNDENKNDFYQLINEIKEEFGLKLKSQQEELKSQQEELKSQQEELKNHQNRIIYLENELFQKDKSRDNKEDNVTNINSNSENLIVIPEERKEKKKDSNNEDPFYSLFHAKHQLLPLQFQTVIEESIGLSSKTEPKGSYVYPYTTELINLFCDKEKHLHFKEYYYARLKKNRYTAKDVKSVILDLYPSLSRDVHFFAIPNQKLEIYVDSSYNRLNLFILSILAGYSNIKVWVVTNDKSHFGELNQLYSFN